MARAALNAIDILKADHREVEALFEKVKQRTCIGKEREALVGDICLALKNHAAIEEEIAYPAFRAAGVESHILDEAEIEHDSIKQLIASLQSTGANEPHYDARVTVLGEYVKHHVREEEGEMFPLAQASDADLDAIGRDLIEVKRQLDAGSSSQRTRNMLGIGTAI
ncbi:hemerythrin domain-containing protein [Hypericibacter sp.]|uniref:hemerythrin domain-containing protein n=1 Tax=Hypericibacter sp. TaxID=2705401 RepID=UPI003D6D15E9